MCLLSFDSSEDAQISFNMVKESNTGVMTLKGIHASLVQLELFESNWIVCL